MKPGIDPVILILKVANKIAGDDIHISNVSICGLFFVISNAF